MKIGLPTRVPYPRALAAAAGACVVYLLLGFLLAPRLVERSIPSFVADKLQRKATVGEVRINPFLLRAEIRDFALAERDGAAIAGFKRLVVDFQLSSLPRWAWTFSEITLEGLDVRADIAPGGRFNLAALLEDLARGGHPDDKPPRVLLQRVVLRDGAIVFSDRSDPTPATARLGPVNFELHDISTLADHKGEYAVSARLADGGDLRWNGDVSLEPPQSRGEISIKGVKPLTAWRFLQDETGLAEPRGEIDYSARYRVGYAGGVVQAMVEDLRIAGRDIALTLSGEKRPVLMLAAFEVSGGRFDLATRELVLPSVELRDGLAVAEVDSSGRINWQRLVKATPVTDRAQPEVAPASPARSWKVKVESLRMAGIGVDYTDRSRARPIRLAVKDLAARLAAAVETRPAGAQVVMDGLALTLKQVAAGEPAPANPLVAFDAVMVEGGRVDLEDKRVDIARVAVTGGAARIARDKDGAFPIMELLSSGDAGLLRREVEGALKQAKSEGNPWRIGIETAELSGARIALSDLGFGEPVAYDVQDLRARVGGFRSDGKGPVRFDASLRLAQGGSLSAAGTYRVAENQVEARGKFDRINLKPLHPALASRARVVFASGDLSGDVKLQYRSRKGRPVVRLSGPISLDNFLINEKGDGARLLGWKSLATDSVRLSLDPDELRIGEMRIAGLGAKVVVNKDRSLNLVQAFTPEPGQAGTASQAPTAPAPAPAGDAEPSFLVEIGRVSVDQGAVDFSDLSLVLPFAANVKELDGVVQGVSTNHDSRASVRMDGRVDEFGLARVEGSLKPFRPKSFLDLNVTFRNIEMPPLSPYTATFAGRRIATGRLALDLRYKIENSQLAGDNRVLLEKFTLGERVEAPGALSLPLDLAVAVLTDSQGRIDLAVPVSGNVDDPKFSYGHVIWQAIVNVLTRIVTAPFRALGALFGAGGGENLENIAFDPGRAVLLPPEREKLKQIAEGIAKRPQLKLVAEGQTGTADQAALRQRDVENAVSARLRRPTAPDATTEPVNVTEARTQRALEAIYIERNSEKALDEFAAGAEKTRGKPVARVNPVLALAGRGSSDSAFYEALLKRLVDSARLPDDALRQLADARARAVTDYLVTTLSVPADRVATRVAAERGEARVKFAFDVVAAGVPRDSGNPPSSR